jgi:preprotein translocase subunit SecD
MLNVVFILGVLAGFGATLTLPGIAGIILTIGMAVDANVLINERAREELEGGKTLRAAIDAGYDKAFSAILDSNITTFLTGIILYQFGTGPVQGFALTLMIGIVATMFSAVFITRLVFALATDKGWTPTFG